MLAWPPSPPSKLPPSLLSQCSKTKEEAAAGGGGGGEADRQLDNGSRLEKFRGNRVMEQLSPLLSYLLLLESGVHTWKEEGGGEETWSRRECIAAGRREEWTLDCHKH